MDIAFHRPEPVLRVPAQERTTRCWESDDLCVVDSTHRFIRGAVLVPVSRTEPFAWGIWAKVSKPQFDDYLSRWNEDRTSEPPFPGHAASSIALPEYADLEGHPLSIQLGPADKRPTFLLSESEHLLSQEQRTGIDMVRVHCILERLWPHLFA